MRWQSELDRRQSPQFSSDFGPPHEELNRKDAANFVYIYNGGCGYEAEFADGGGRTVAMVNGGTDDVRPIEAGVLLNVRCIV